MIPPNKRIIECESKQRTRPTLALYKPPVLRGEQPFLPKKLEKKQSHPKKEKCSAVADDKLRQDPLSISLLDEIDFQKVENSSPAAGSSPPEFDELVANLKEQLDLNDTKIGDFLLGRIVPHRKLSQYIGEFLVKYCIEDSGHHKQQAKRGLLTKSFMELASSTVAVAFCNGIAKALRRYYECRHQLRENEKYLMYWLNFVALTFEFGQIAQEENVVQLIFDIFSYLMSEPVVRTLKISELEHSLSVLMIIGRRMEHDYPAQLNQLRELLRNAFLAASETWTRKMLLLMVELSAGAEWRMTPELEEYYFR